MPKSTKGRKEELDPYQRLCRNCEFFQSDEPMTAADAPGICFANPPQTLADEGEIVYARPTVHTNDLACRHFKQRLQS